MKCIFTMALMLLGSFTFAQDTTYYGSKGEPVKSLKESDTYSVVRKNEADTSRSIIKNFYKSGQLKSESRIINASRITDGKIKEWYSNGQLKYDYLMKNGKLEDTVTTYYQTGIIKRKDLYQDDVLKDGHSYGINGKEVRHTNFYRAAMFPGGAGEVRNFLSNEIRYPKTAIKKNIQGTVYIQFRVMKDGSVADPFVYQGVSTELDNEALRVVKKMPAWTPAMVDGETEISYFKLPINFSLVP